MLDVSTATLVGFLDHPNGWWRENAQKEIIVRNDQSVVPALKEIAKGGNASLAKDPGPLARVHALWTLEGLNAMDKNTLFAAFSDKDYQVRKAAVWISELYIRKNDGELINRLDSLKNDPSPDVRIQLMLSLRTNKTDKAKAIVKRLLISNSDNQLMQYSYVTFREAQERLAAEHERTKNLSPADRKLVTTGATIFKQLCATCHGPDGKGILIGGKPMPAPPLVGSPRVKGDKISLVQLMLYGLTGPVDGKSYPDRMPAQVGNDDAWIASVLSYVRNSGELGNASSVVTTEEVKEVRANTPNMKDGFTLQLLEIFKLGRAERKNWGETETGKK
jgi:mono/diheme cytochrome c family protein